MLILIDNFDSFAHNLARYLRRLGAEVRVLRNNETDAAELAALPELQGIVVSPGPCTPREAGCSLGVIERLAPQYPILGVCLGHQAIAAAYGAEIVRATEPRHGRSSRITHVERGVFQGLKNPLTVGRYHSLVVRPETLPRDLEITAWDDQGVIMAIAHRTLPLFGVQFHPESILTEQGLELLGNFTRTCGIPAPAGVNSQADEYAPRAQIAHALPERPITF